MKLLAIIALLGTAAPASGPPPQGSAEQRALRERAIADQARFERRLFAEAGFDPLEDVGAQGRSVKRALFADPYMMLPVPGVEVARAKDGAVTLKVVGRSGASEPVRLPASDWAHLAEMQGTMLDPAPYVPDDPPKPGETSPPPPICHGWIVRFGAADASGTASGSWSQCGGERGAKQAFAAEMARLAVSTRPSCKFDAANPFWSFNTCFSPPRS